MKRYRRVIAKPVFEVDNMNNSSKLQINHSSKKASEIIRSKLIKNGGTATVKSQLGKIYEISISRDGKAFETRALPTRTPYEFSVFDIVADLLIEQGGRARKGNAHKSKYGQGACTDETVVGRIARDYWFKKHGESTPDPIMVINAIMTWAGITKFVRGEMQFTAAFMVYLHSAGNSDFLW